jgi:hypothetical protein
LERGGDCIKFVSSRLIDSNSDLVEWLYSLEREIISSLVSLMGHLCKVLLRKISQVKVAHLVITHDSALEILRGGVEALKKGRGF